MKEVAGDRNPLVQQYRTALKYMVHRQSCRRPSQHVFPATVGPAILFQYLNHIGH